MDIQAPQGSSAKLTRAGAIPGGERCFASIVVLAAGRSTRFGRNKMLEPMGKTSLIEKVVSESLGSKARQVIVVVGHAFEAMRSKLQGYACEMVYNEEFESGQSSSVRKGVSMVSGRADAVMILPGDMVLMERSIIDAVIDEYDRTRAPIVNAGYEGRQGHPILFDRSLFGELAGIAEPTRGLKAVVARHSAEVVTVETSLAAVLDMDTPGDLARLAEVSPGGRAETSGSHRRPRN